MVTSKTPDIKSQQQVWNLIAPEWYEYKNNSDPKVIEFVEKAKGKKLIPPSKRRGIGCLLAQKLIY